MQKIKNTLTTWLFKKPMIFMLLSFTCMIVFSFIISILDSVLDLSDTTSGVLMFIFALISFIYPIYYLIKKLPNDKMYRKDFIAIVNGTSIISVFASLIAILTIGLYSSNIQQDLMFMYMLQPLKFAILCVILISVTLYLVGVAVSGIYAKYKRCKQTGLDTWKIVLSMPFGFLMLWTPGYLINEKNEKSVVSINSNWYSKFNKWVVSNFSNTLFIFLLLLFVKNIISGLPTLLLSISLLILYTLWYVKHKSDFIQNINHGYALTAVGINIAIIIAVLLQYV